MKKDDLITSDVYSDIKSVSDGHRLYLNKRYPKARKTIKEWGEICKSANITIKDN